MEEDVIDISLRRRKNVVKAFIDLTKSEIVEQKVTLFTIPQYNAHWKKSKSKKKLMQTWIWKKIERR